MAAETSLSVLLVIRRQRTEPDPQATELSRLWPDRKKVRLILVVASVFFLEDFRFGPVILLLLYDDTKEEGIEKTVR